MMQENTPSSSRFISTLTKQTLALILAGGRGTRLKDLTNWRAKPAVHFGGKFRIIDFPLSNCINSGIRRIGVVTQYKAHSLIQHIQRGWNFMRGEFGEFVELLPAQQRIKEEWYKGTADAVFQNIDILRTYDPEYTIILAGDHVYKMDYGKMLAGHVLSQADMTVACITVPIEEASAFGVMTVDENNRITGFLEKPKNPAPMPGHTDKVLASMGIYVFNTKFLYEQLIRDALDTKSSHDFGHDIIPYLISRYRTIAHQFEDSCVGEPHAPPYWRDVGTVDAYWEANMELTKVVPDLNMYDKQWPIWTYQAQLPPAKFVFDEAERRGLAIDSLVSGGCVISGASVRRSVLFSDVRVNCFSQVEDSVILPRVTIGENVVLKRVIVDKGCTLPNGLQVGADPEQDRARFYVSEKGITVITADMLGQRLHGM
ncbi:MAG TPA: glucose-1-phosphate adenylyltransferase [Gallionellaceae bacterium]|nr:glucose-1-phosphate adenylyltransferase [Gallionellaceae bacterium]